MKRLITLIIVALSLMVVGNATATSAHKASHHCRADMSLPASDHYPDNYYDDVWVKEYRGMTCGLALHIAGEAYALPGLRPIYDPSRFGPGGYGGPFHVGHFQCWLSARLSDMRFASCHRGKGYLRFVDHRNSDY